MGAFKNMFADAARNQQAHKQFLGASKNQARDDWNSSFYGKGGTTPLSEFQSSKNTRYAMENIGWDKSQDLRRKAEAADVGAVAPTGGNKLDRRYNYSTGEMEWLQKEDSNYWKANKDDLITMGGALLGTILLPGVGTSLGMSLAKTGREVKKMRDARRDFKDDKREYQYDQWQDQLAADEARRANMGNLFRSGGEGVVEYATKDITKKKRDQLVRAT